MKIALIAHDKKKSDMIDLAVRFRDVRIVWDTDSPNWKYGVMAENTDIAEIGSGCDFGKPVKQADGR